MISHPFTEKSKTEENESNDVVRGVLSISRREVRRNRVSKLYLPRASGSIDKDDR